MSISISEKINDILEDDASKNQSKKRSSGKSAISPIELLMEWLFKNYDFRINGYSQQVEFKAKNEQDHQYRELNDITLNTIRIQALTEGFSKNMATSIDIVIKSEYVKIHYGIEEYFKRYEQEDRQEPWHTPTIRAYFDKMKLANPEDSEMLYHLFQRYIVACVNSGLRRKHNDVMLLLIGEQGKFKTSYLENLVPLELKKDYLYSGHIQPSMTDQNTANYLAEKFFINIDDQLEIIFGKEYNSMKAIISSSQITNRKVFAKTAVTRPRIANFMGSVNGREFLTDHENRRYLVIELKEISGDYKTIDMNAFWQEAYNTAMQVNPYSVFSRQEYMDISAMAGRYVLNTVEESLVLNLFMPKQSDEYSYELFMQTSELLNYLQDSTKRNLSQTRLTNALKKNGFDNRAKKLKRLGNSTRYGWLLYSRLGPMDLSSLDKYFSIPGYDDSF